MRTISHQIKHQIQEWYGQIRSFIFGCFESIRRRPWFALVPILVGAASWWYFGTGPGVLWFSFLIFLVYGWESKVIGSLAILSLTACPILISLNHAGAAEHMAVYALFFLVMAVALQIADLVRERKNKSA